MAGEDRSQSTPGTSFGYWQDLRNMTRDGTQLTATEEERWNQASAPGGDTVNWSYVPQYGWQYRGNQVHGTAGKSSYLNDNGERVHYDSPAGFDQFNTMDMEHARAMNNAERIWSRGGDVFAQEGGRYSAENPYVESPEEAASRRAASAAYASKRVYDAATDTTWYGGGVGQGFSSKGERKTIPITDEMRAAMNDPSQRNYSGVGSFSQQGRDILNEAFNGRAFSPFDGIMGNSEAVDHLIEKFQDDGFNPLYARGSGNAYDNRRSDNIMDYIYKEFGGNDQIANRQEVLKRFNSWKEESGLKSNHMYHQTMDEGTFNRLGLNEFKDFNKDFSQGTGLPSVNPFSQSTNGRGMIDGKSIDVKQGGFLDSYLRRRAEEKPSVMSLMKELEDS